MDRREAADVVAVRLARDTVRVVAAAVNERTGRGADLEDCRVGADVTRRCVLVHGRRMTRGARAVPRLDRADDRVAFRATGGLRRRLGSMRGLQLRGRGIPAGRIRCSRASPDRSRARRRDRDGTPRSPRTGASHPHGRRDTRTALDAVHRRRRIHMQRDEVARDVALTAEAARAGRPRRVRGRQTRVHLLRAALDVAAALDARLVGRRR